MDKKYKIRLGETKSVDSINTDSTINLKLDSNKKNIIDYNKQEFIDVSELFDNERQNSEKYRIFGSINYFSLLNNINEDYYNIEDFFRIKEPDENNLRNITTDFNIFIVKPIPPEDYRLVNGNLSDGYEEIGTNSLYLRSFEIISEINKTNYTKLGYSVNLFNEEIYGYIFNEVFDIKNEVDGLGFPLDELYLYFQYIPKLNGEDNAETVRRRVFSGLSSSKLLFNFTNLSVGDIIYGDIIRYNEENLTQTIIREQEYFIDVPYENGTIRLKYNPFMPIKLRQYSDDIERVSLDSTVYEEIESVPDYAKVVDNYYVWKNFIDKGFIDPLTGQGVDYPFINDTNYIHKNITLSVIPDLTASSTSNIFGDIRYELNNSFYQLNNNINDDISKLC